MTTDVASLTNRSARLEIADVDFGDFERRPLDADTLRCLRFMHDVEFHTMCYLRELLVTRAHRDPEITAFLACWVYEEHWHGDAIRQILERHGEPAGAVRVAAVRNRLARRDALRPILFALSSALAPDFLAIHMAWGAINEWTTQAGYGRLAKCAGHPVLSTLLGRIMRQEGRHIDFYAGEARRRLTSSPAARRVARFALSHFWAPVGTGVMPKDELAFLATHLFGGADGVEAARRVDRQVARLPGLEGLALLERSVERLDLGRAALAA